jgi:prepilin-type N-terminal cleavage/methylation domain-containing protein
MQFSNSNLQCLVCGISPKGFRKIAQGCRAAATLGSQLRVGTHPSRRSASLGSTQSSASSRPFTGVPAAGGPRPGVYAGLTAKRDMLSGPFTGLLLPASPSPAPRKNRLRRCGFTLIEMLIVIAIMLILVAAVATIMPSASESRRMREAARSVNIYLSSARNEAMASGRPCGVTFHHFGTVPCAMNADQCKVPPDYEGTTEQSMASVNTSAGTVSLVSNEVLPSNMVKRLDLIQFNRQGVIYQITGNINGSEDTSTKFYSSVSQFSITAYSPNPAPTPPTYSHPVPFRIFRSPVKSGATPLQLPTSTVVDLEFSSTDGVLGPGTADLTVVFSPTGAIASVNGNPVTGTLYILIGRRERAGTFTPVGQVPPATKVESQFTNVEDLGNLWVTINSQTGLINTEPLADGATTAACNAAAGNSDQTARTNAMIAAMNTARNLARQAIGMGGK